MNISSVFVMIFLLITTYTQLVCTVKIVTILSHYANTLSSQEVWG